MRTGVSFPESSEGKDNGFRTFTLPVEAVPLEIAIVANDEVDPVTGSFIGESGRTDFLGSGSRSEADYADGDGNEVVEVPFIVFVSGSGGLVKASAALARVQLRLAQLVGRLR